MRGILKGRVYTKQEQENQKLRIGSKEGSWSINLDELPDDAQVIAYITEEDTYTISKQDALAHGFEQTLGGEPKLVVPINKWQKGGIAVDE